MARRRRMPASLVITVDTEPHDQWAPPVGGRLPPFTFANTRGLDRLKDHLHGLGVPVTWMTSYGVARDARSAVVLRRAAAEGDEIAGHLRGWETPPFVEMDQGARPFIYEYPQRTRFEKHQSLVAAHEDAFGARPVSYRAGRWALDAIELEHLAVLGDSSIPPGIDFRDRSGLRALGPDFRRHLCAGPAQPYRAGPLWEVPVSITPAGLFGTGAVGAGVARLAGGRGPADQISRWAYRALDATGLHRLVWVRPLKHPRSLLVAAARSLVRQGARIINVMFHSSEAFVGTSPVSRTEGDVIRLYDDLTAIVIAVHQAGVVPRTLRDATTLGST
ncbi:MAG: hypothetical protein M3495_19060 [Pseudomonadota bacterium]|nr:hypothetical protein [Gammaproteobacteria bacterium]MDQ3583569.1 hypothetical protein [Pseudomonadota bacterium]